MRAQVKHTRVEGERRLVFSSEWLKKTCMFVVMEKMQPFFFLQSIMKMSPSRNCIVKFIWNRTKIP